jgi:hypothetical protein
MVLLLVLLVLSLLLSLVSSSPSLIQSASDFFVFDYNRIDSFNNDIFRFFINPATPFLGVFLYLALSKPVFTYIRKTFNINPKGPILQNAVVLHSGIIILLLSPFSSYYHIIIITIFITSALTVL